MNIIRHISYFLYMFGIVILYCTAFASQDSTSTEGSSGSADTSTVLEIFNLLPYVSTFLDSWFSLSYYGSIDLGESVDDVSSSDSHKASENNSSGQSSTPQSIESTKSKSSETKSSADVEAKNIDVSNRISNANITVKSFTPVYNVEYDIFSPRPGISIEKVKDRSIELPLTDTTKISSVSVICNENNTRVIQVKSLESPFNIIYFRKPMRALRYTEVYGQDFFTFLRKYLKNATLDVLANTLPEQHFHISGNSTDSNGTVSISLYPKDDVFVESVNAGDFNFFTYNGSDITTVERVKFTKSNGTLKCVSISLISATGTRIYIDFNGKDGTFVPSSGSNMIIRGSATTTAETVENQISIVPVDTTNGADVGDTKIDIRNKTPNDYITVKSFTPKEHVKYDIFISSKSIKTVMDGTKELPLKDEPKIRSVSMLTTDNNTKVIQVKSLESPYNIIYFRKLMRDSHFTDADGKQFFTLLRKYLKNVTLDISAADLPEADFGIGYGSDSDGTKSTTLCPNDDVFVESVNAGHFNFFTFNESDITTVERVKFTKRGDTLIRVSISLVSVTGTRIYIDFNGKDGTFVPSSGSNKFIRTRVTTNPAVGQENTNELTGQTTPVASTDGGKSTENQSRGTETKGTPSQGTTAKTVENQMSTVPVDTTDGVNVEVSKIDVSNKTGNDDITVKSFTLNDGVTYDIFIPLKSINIVMDGSIELPMIDTARIRSVSLITTDTKKVIQVEAQPTGNDLKLINKMYYYKPNGSDSYTRADGEEFFTLLREYLDNVTLDILGKGLPEKDFFIGNGFDSSGNVFTRLYPKDNVFVRSVNAGKSNLFTFDESDIATMERVKLTKSGNTLKSVSILLVSATGTRTYIDFNEKNGTFVPLSRGSTTFIRGSVTHKPDIEQENTDELTGESNFDAKPTVATLVVALVTFVSIMYDGNTTI